MAQAAAIGKKKKAKKRKGRGFVVNRNTYIRRNTTSNTEGGANSGIVTAGELLFAAAGLGIGYLLFQYFTTKGATTTPTGGGGGTLPNPTPTGGGGATPINFSCRLPSDEIVERRINGTGCGCADCSSVRGFNFKNETI